MISCVGPPESLSVLLVRVLLSSVLVQCALLWRFVRCEGGQAPSPLSTEDFYSEPAGTACLSMKLFWKWQGSWAFLSDLSLLAASSAELGAFPDGGHVLSVVSISVPGTTLTLG